jgi:hypothetical protein
MTMDLVSVENLYLQDKHIALQTELKVDFSSYVL